MLDYLDQLDRADQFVAQNAAKSAKLTGAKSYSDADVRGILTDHAKAMELDACLAPLDADEDVQLLGLRGRLTHLHAEMRQTKRLLDAEGDHAGQRGARVADQVGEARYLSDIIRRVEAE